MSAVGWYYLHVNGELIYKPEYDGGVAADIRESDLARCMWSVDPHDREGAWGILIESLALGANPARVRELAEKWGCDDADAEHYAGRVGLSIAKDGNKWRATGPSFENLQESPAGFGDTKLEAISDMAKNMGLRAGKMWRQTFSDLLKTQAAKVAGEPA
jgi:hypothetical protein